MAGRPLIAAKRQADRARMIRQRMPASLLRVPNDEWKKLRTEQQIAVGFGFAISDLNELFAVPFREDDLHNRTLRIRVFEVCMRLGMKYMDLEAKREAGAALLEGLEQALKTKRAEAGE